MQPLTTKLDRLETRMPHEKLARLHPADLAEILTQVPVPERSGIFMKLDVETAAETLHELEPEVQVELIEEMPAPQASDILEQMPADEAADVLGDLPGEQAQDLVQLMEKEAAAEVGPTPNSRLERVAQRFERIGNPARREPIGLGALAERVAGYFRPRLPRHANPIELRVEAAGAGPTAMGDQILLEWALESLVKNAIDALRGRSGTIILRVESEGRQGVLRVIDDGPGIEGSIRRTLFQPGITTKTGGWGIGLALATRVAQEAHEGDLALEPTSTGACFRARRRLPGRDLLEPARRGPSAPSSAPGSNKPQ